MDVETESIDIASIKRAALDPLQALTWPGLEAGSFSNVHLQAIRDAVECPTEAGSTDSTFQPAQYVTQLAQLDSLACLASTVPDSQIVAQPESYPQTAQVPPIPQFVNSLQKMSSQITPPDDTQPLSPSIYRNIVESRSAQRLDQHWDTANAETQGTLNEGDEGHVNLLESYNEDPAKDNDAGPQHLDEYSPTQTQTRLPQFPESQRFKTPATAGKKRSYNGDIIETPVLPRNPLFRGGEPTPGKIMGLSQAFAATSSPLLSSHLHLLPSDLPSPDIEVRTRPISSSSPLLEFQRSENEPLARYVPVKESQEQRDLRAQSEPTDRAGLEESYDDFGVTPKRVVQQRRMREREKVADQQLKAVSSPRRAQSKKIKHHISSSPVKPPIYSPRPSPRGYGKRREPLYLPGLSDDIHSSKDTSRPHESEEETDHESEIEIAVRRSSQPPIPTEEDKENAPYEAMRVPETTARLQHVMDGYGAEESSPSRGNLGGLQSSEPEQFAVADSQPSQSRGCPLFKQTARLVSSGEGSDFVPQSQLVIGNVLKTQGRSSISKPSAAGLVEYGPDNEETNRTEQRDSKPSSSRPLSTTQAVEKQFGSIIQETSSILVTESRDATASGSLTNSSKPGLSEAPVVRSSTQFDTAPSHLSGTSLSAPKSPTRSLYPALTSPRITKRKNITDILAQASPERSGSDALHEMLAEMQDPDLVDLLASQSPIRPGRTAKRRPVAQKPFARTFGGEMSTSHLSLRTETEIDLPQHKEPDFDHGLDSADTAKTANGLYASEAEVPVVGIDSLPNLAHGLRTVKTRSNKRSGRAVSSIWDVQESPPVKPTVSLSTKSSPKVPKAPQIRLSNTTPPNVVPSLTQKRAAKAVSTSSGAKNIPKIASTAPVVSRTTEQIKDRPEDDIIAPNQIWACFNGKNRVYYPTSCLGMSGSDTPKYLIQWDGYDPEEVDAPGIRSLDLRVGDVVKVNLVGFPKISHVIRGFKDKVETCGSHEVTDIRGFRTLLLVPKQRKSLPADLETENIVEVPVATIYLDSNMWGQMKDREFEYVLPPQPRTQIRFGTPIEKGSIPSTPSSRTRRNAASFSAVPTLSGVGIFSNMAFAISYDDRSRKSTLGNLIAANGGMLLADGFDELLNTQSMELKPALAQIGFVALVADRHSRKEKYMQALALNLPCISGKWIESCIAQQRVVDWQVYLLPAGESMMLEGATRSRTLPDILPARTKLAEVLEQRPKLLKGSDAIVVMGKGKTEERRKPYLFLTQALGAGRIEKAVDMKAAKAALRDHEFDWVFVEDRDVEMAKAVLGKAGKGENGPRVVGNELIVQSLILGALFEE